MLPTEPSLRHDLERVCGEEHGVARTNESMPRNDGPRIGAFDRFANTSADVVSRAPFFALCVLIVAAWLVEGIARYLQTGRLSSFLDSAYQLQINTTTTIITFLLVALLQNTQRRSDRAMHHKLDAIADGLADLMDHLADRSDDADLRTDISELRLSVGLEDRGASQRGTDHRG
jgi:Low affinity iron permease